MGFGSLGELRLLVVDSPVVVEKAAALAAPADCSAGPRTDAKTLSNHAPQLSAAAADFGLNEHQRDTYL